MSAAVTHDRLFGGAIALAQPARGYRVNVDALLLAAFCGQRRVSLLVDLGAGVGGVALSVHHLTQVKQAELVEKDPGLAALARQNLSDNALPGGVHELDLTSAVLPRELIGAADLVVSNPPYFDPKSARRAQDPAASSARFGELSPFVRASARLLAGPRARACYCWPARSLERLLSEAAREKLVLKRLRFVHATAADPARLALVELRRAKPGGALVEPPLVEWSASRERSPELSRLIAATAVGRTRSQPPPAR